jgi:ribosomal protein S18 acetylase RimI-like enzyme
MLEINFSQNDIAPEDMPAINSLVAQLSSTPKNITFEQIQKVMKSGFIFTARNNNNLVGITTLTLIHKPTASFGTVEDVVVDKNFRQMGIAKSLMNQLIKKAKELGLNYIDLTSSPKKEVANKLYPSLNFQLRKTNYYRLSL